MPSTTAVTTGGLPLPLALLTTGGGQAAPGVAAAVTSAAAKKTTTKTTSARSPAKTAKASTATKKTTGTTSSAAKATGYATKLPADYAFLQDPRISIEEKLSRFIGLLMAKSEQDLQRQMEKMAPGSTAASGASAGSTGSTAKPKSTGFSLWGLAKQLLPPLNLASQLVGDTQLKALASKVTGPVLAAAATAVGLPQLAPLAEKYGPTLVSALSKDISTGLAALTGGGTSGSTGTSGTATASGSASKAGAADPATSEKAQLMELQRLQDRDKELFTLFSNMLKAMHDARMTSIQNIR